jgi:hypothetical protein
MYGVDQLVWVHVTSMHF